MAFVRTRTIKGRKYYSLEERYREGGKVKSRWLRSLTSAADFIGANLRPDDYGVSSALKAIEDEKAKQPSSPPASSPEPGQPGEQSGGDAEGKAP